MNEQQIKPIKWIPTLGKHNDGERTPVRIVMAEETADSKTFGGFFVPMSAWKEK